MPYTVKGFFEIDEDMVQILLVLEVLFTQDSEVEDLFCGASSRSEPSLFFSNYFFSLGFKPVQNNFREYGKIRSKVNQGCNSFFCPKRGIKRMCVTYNYPKLRPCKRI